MFPERTRLHSDFAGLPGMGIDQFQVNAVRSHPTDQGRNAVRQTGPDVDRIEVPDPGVA